MVNTGVIFRKFISAVLLSGFLGGICITANAQRVVTDVKTNLRLINNIAQVTVVENRHNQKLDSISTYQKKIEKYTAAMAVITEAYKYTMENIKGFQQDSKFYVEIGMCAGDIVTRIPKVMSAFKESRLPGKALCIKELTDMALKTQQLVGDYVNIVNNAKIENPLKTGNAKKQGDGYNFLDRYDRLTVAYKIYSDLSNLRYKMIWLEQLAKYANWRDFFWVTDPDSWICAMAMDNQVKTLINRWNGLIK